MHFSAAKELLNKSIITVLYIVSVNHLVSLIMIFNCPAFSFINIFDLLFSSS